MRICKTAEVKYFENPNADKNMLNYALYTHIVLRDYMKARLVYGEAMRRMVHRGPDVAFILYAYAVFAFVSHDQDLIDCKIMIERAQIAEQVRFEALRVKRVKRDAYGYRDLSAEHAPGDDPEASKCRLGKAFELADIGFYKHTALVSHDHEAWHNYAACRFLVYDDYLGSFDAFLTAFRYNPSDKRLLANFFSMMSHYHGPDEEKINEIVKERLRGSAPPRRAYRTDSYEIPDMDMGKAVSVVLRIQVRKFALFTEQVPPQFKYGSGQAPQ